LLTGPLQAEAKSHLLCYDDDDSILFQREFRRLRFGSVADIRRL
jgi:hypothetical protein